MSLEQIPTVFELVKSASQVFRERFHREADVFTYAPGRVNLMGEHTDYNDGYVMPMALPLVTVVAGVVRSDSSSNILATIYTTAPTIAEANRKITIEVSQNDSNEQQLTVEPTSIKWGHYIRGVIANFGGCHQLPPPIQAVIVSSVPIGGGLSSSAALEVAMYTFLEAITESCNQPSTTTASLSKVEKALACQRAEQYYAQVPCGIMDQYVAFMAQAENALLIDCRDLTSQLVPFTSSSEQISVDNDVVIFIANTNVRHELAASEYSVRKRECQQAAHLLNKSSLRDADLTDIEYLHAMSDVDPKLIRRARHVITENYRVQQAAKALQQADYVRLGALMQDSHRSLRDDYEVSCQELDRVVALSMEVEGVKGCRMTGGGFGGCTVALVERRSVDALVTHLRENYRGGDNVVSNINTCADHLMATCYVCRPENGTAIFTANTC